jgi:hypothetical protein
MKSVMDRFGAGELARWRLGLSIMRSFRLAPGSKPFRAISCELNVEDCEPRNQPGEFGLSRPPRQQRLHRLPRDGRKIDPVSRKRARRAAKRDRMRMMRGEAPLTEAKKRGPKPKLLGRILKKDLFYIIIINMPSQEEMDAAFEAAVGKEGGEGMSGRKSENEWKETSEKTEQDGKMDL